MIIEIRTKKDIRKNYWDGFDTVATLCKILYTFDEMNERGYHYYYEADW